MIKYLRDRLRTQWLFYQKVVRNNSGVSSKNYVLVTGVQMGKWWMLVFFPAMLFLDQVFGLKPSISYSEIAILVGAIEGFVAVFLGLKVWSEKYERNKDDRRTKTTQGPVHGDVADL